MDDRYSNDPMLRFLDAYALDAMGELDISTRKELEDIAPDIAAALGVPVGSWQAVVKSAMEFPDDVPSIISGWWRDFQQQAESEKVEADPITFAHFIVDSQLSA
jgi:hypothetical protein